MNLRGKRAFERAHRHARGRLAGCVNQIGNAFGLRQIQFVVQKGAFGEFARFGNARTQFQTALQQHLQHDLAAVSLQFEHVFAGEAGGRGKIQQQPVVDGVALGIEKIGVQRGARFRNFAAGDLLRERQQVFARDADNADPTAPVGSGNGGDGGGCACG